MRRILKPRKGGIAPPPQVYTYNLLWNDEFDIISLYNTDASPTGRWRMNEFWMSAQGAGYVDLGSNRHFNINQTTTDNYAAGVMRPWFPVSQPQSSVLRLTAYRARTNAGEWILSADMRALVNTIAAAQHPSLVDQVTWTGAQLTNYRIHPDVANEFGRPAYVEMRARWSPSVAGFSSAFWLLHSSTQPGYREIDVFETDTLLPSSFNTNLWPAQSGPKSTLHHEHAWADGDFHIIGFHWTESLCRVWWDNIESGMFGPSTVAPFDQKMRTIFGIGGPPQWAQPSQFVPDGTSTLTFDVDWIRIWGP